MTAIVLVHGTYGRAAPWHRPGSPLWRALEERGFTPIQFLWSGLCGGVPGPVIVPPSTDEIKGSLELWRSEGEKLAYFCRLMGLERPILLTHSHGLAVGVFAAVAGQKFSTFLSLSGPVRADMAFWRSRARPNIDRWVQATDPTGDDRTILEGEAFDGHVGWNLELPEADVNLSAPHQGHSGLTTDPNAWGPLGLWAQLDPA